MNAVRTERGILIPKEALVRLGEVVVDEQPFQIVIRPKSMTEATRGLVGNGDTEATDRLIEAIEAGEV